ncbi:hypothetical protein [Streptomyces sp. NPDC090994]|uniref:hypothetical protein n=1 Tax=Streptomyces sp. NPDC090994 TaxID=3365969 RepID=UPI003814AC50
MTVTDPLGATTRYTYDDLGRPPLSVGRPDNTTAVLTYDEDGTRSRRGNRAGPSPAASLSRTRVSAGVAGEERVTRRSPRLASAMC